MKCYCLTMIENVATACMGKTWTCHSEVALVATDSVHLIESVMVGSDVGIHVLLLAAVFARNLNFLHTEH